MGVCACVCTELLQLCPTLCNPTDHSLPSSLVHGILQARILEWIAIHSLLQGIFLIQGSKLRLLCLLLWQEDSLPLVPSGKPQVMGMHTQIRQIHLGSSPKAPQMGIIWSPFHIWTSVCRHRSLEFFHFNTRLAKGNGREEDRKKDQLFLKIFSGTPISFENLMNYRHFRHSQVHLHADTSNFVFSFRTPLPANPHNNSWTSD